MFNQKIDWDAVERDYVGMQDLGVCSLNFFIEAANKIRWSTDEGGKRNKRILKPEETEDDNTQVELKLAILDGSFKNCALSINFPIFGDSGSAGYNRSLFLGLCKILGIDPKADRIGQLRRNNIKISFKESTGDKLNKEGKPYINIDKFGKADPAFQNYGKTDSVQTKQQDDDDIPF